MSENTAWAVIERTEPYHPEGDPNRTATEFTYWIYNTSQEAARAKASLLLHSKFSRRIEVRAVAEESWTNRFGAKIKPAPEATAEVVEEPKKEGPKPKATCQGCGKTFKGERGLRTHQRQKFVAMGCRPIEEGTTA